MEQTVTNLSINLEKIGEVCSDPDWEQLAVIAKRLRIPVAALFLDWSTLAKAMKQPTRSCKQLESQESNREFTP